MNLEENVLNDFQTNNRSQARKIQQILRYFRNNEFNLR